MDQLIGLKYFVSFGANTICEGFYNKKKKKKVKRGRWFYEINFVRYTNTFHAHCTPTKRSSFHPRLCIPKSPIFTRYCIDWNIHSVCVCTGIVWNGVYVTRVGNQIRANLFSRFFFRSPGIPPSTLSAGSIFGRD